MEQEAAQDSAEENSIDSVNINLIHFNKNWSIKTSASINNVVVPYKVDTDSYDTIMPLHIYKKLLPKITSEQLAAAKNESIKLKTYYKPKITQLHTCAVELEHKNNKKKCR